MLRHCRFYQGSKYVGFCQQDRINDAKGEFYPIDYNDSEPVEVERYVGIADGNNWIKREFRE